MTTPATPATPATAAMPANVRQALEDLARQQRPAQMPDEVRRAAGLPPPPPPPRGVLQTIDDMVRMGAQGFTMGYGDEIAAGGNAAVGAVRDFFVPRTLSDEVTNQPRGFSARYEANLADERRRDEEARAASPWLAPAAEITGGVLGGGKIARALPWLFGASRTAPIVTRTLEGVRGGTIGGALGGFGAGEGGFENRVGSAVQGGLLGGVIGAAVPAVASAVGQTAAPVMNLLGLRNAPQAAREQLLRAFERDGISLADAERRLTQWQATGARPETLADLGDENVRNLVQRVVNVPGAARVAGREAVEARAGGQGERVLEDVRQLGRGQQGSQYYPELNALDAARKTNARPLYERAYEARFPWTEEVEGMFSAPPLQDAARRAVRMLRTERINPEGEGLRFNEAGDIINVRGLSMRALDYIKRGLDDVIETYRDRGTGRLSLDTEGYGINNLRTDFVRALDAANPDYAAARAAWAGPSRMRDAMEDGREIFTRDAELTIDAVRAMPASERDAFRLGAVRAITDRIMNTTDRRDAVARIFGSPGLRQRLEAAFDDPAALARFRTAMEREANMRQVTPFMNPRANSMTARQLAEGADQETDVPGAAVSALMGEIAPARRALIAGTMNRIQGIGSHGSDALAPLLFQTTAAGNRNALGILQAEQARRAFAEQQARNRLRGTIFGGAAGAAGAAPTMPLPFNILGQ